jgi:hypothetical protein
MTIYASKLYGGITLACTSLIEKEFPAASAFLVGSALESRTRPRDVDVRIVMPNSVFGAHYGIEGDIQQWWCVDRVTWPRPASWWRWVEDQHRMETFISYACGERNIDLSVLPRAIFIAFENDPKKLIAGPELAEDAWI